MQKTKEMLQKTHKKAISHTTMAFKKTMATFRNERKGGPTTTRDPLKRDARHTVDAGNTRNETHTTQFM